MRARRELLRCRSECRADIRLVELLSALGHRRDERNPEAAAPIPEEIGEARSAIVLIRPQLRVRDDVNGHEEETVSKALKSPREHVMPVIRCQRERTEVPQRCRDYGNAERNENTWVDDFRSEERRVGKACRSRW